MKKKSLLVMLVGLVSVFGAGCASSPDTIGKLMIEQSKATMDLGKQWQAGKRRVVDGEKAIAEGKDTIAKGEARVKQGEIMVNDGKKMKEEAELLYTTRFPGKSLELEETK